MVTIEFTEDDYRENEDGDMEITVARNQDVTLANPVIVRITPLTVEEALDRGIITTFDEDEKFSPNRAGNNDNVLINYHLNSPSAINMFNCSCGSC